MAVESQLSWTPSSRPHALGSYGRQNRPRLMRLSTSVPCNLNHLEGADSPGQGTGPTRLLLLGPRPLESARRQNVITHGQPTSSLAAQRLSRAGTPGTPSSPVTTERRWIHISRPGSLEETPPSNSPVVSDRRLIRISRQNSFDEPPSPSSPVVTDRRWIHISRPTSVEDAPPTSSPVTADRRWVHISRPGSMEEAPPPAYDDIDLDGGALSDGSRSSSSSPTPSVAPPRSDVVLESRRSVTRASIPRTFAEPSGSVARDSPEPFSPSSELSAPAFSASSIAARRNSVAALPVASASPAGSSGAAPSNYRAWSPLVTPRLANPPSSSLGYHYHRPSPLSVRSEAMSPFLHSYYNSPLHSYRSSPMQTYRRTHTWAPISSYMVTPRPLSGLSNSIRCGRRSVSNSALSTLSALSSMNSGYNNSRDDISTMNRGYSNSRDDISSVGRPGYSAFHRANSIDSGRSNGLASPSIITANNPALPSTPDSPQPTHAGSPWSRETNSSNPASPTQPHSRFQVSSNSSIPSVRTRPTRSLSHHLFRVAANNSDPASPTQSRIHRSNTIPLQQVSHTPSSSTPGSPVQVTSRPHCPDSRPSSPTQQSPHSSHSPASRRLSLPHVRVSVQRLDLQRQNSEDSEAVRGQIVISLISRDRGGGGVSSQPSTADSSSSSAHQHPPAIPYDPNELPEG